MECMKELRNLFLLVQGTDIFQLLGWVKKQEQKYITLNAKIGQEYIVYNKENITKNGCRVDFTVKYDQNLFVNDFRHLADLGLYIISID